ncbi:enoyl-CoA hydratase-related protein, partial [Aequoribacter sp.]|uniref:enoyl-CoA hydratase-related protein n=1 Tax=Aequoribacter sp. TaxID=2847771 RepID=UPI003F69D792
LINQVVAAGTALEGAKALAAKIAANGPLAVAKSKEVVDSAQDWTSDVMFANQNAIVTPVMNSEDAIEGATAFAEKRAPVWKGR